MRNWQFTLSNALHIYSTIVMSNVTQLSDRCNTSMHHYYRDLCWLAGNSRVGMMAHKYVFPIRFFFTTADEMYTGRDCQCHD